MSTYRDVSTAYYALRTATAAEAVEKLTEYDHDQLVAVLVNEALNQWMSEHSDTDGSELERLVTGTVGGKLIPYIGWYWRSVSFVGGRIPVADCGDFIGFCENNKWGYDQRDLTDDEQAELLALVWKARAADDSSAEKEERDKAVAAALEELWEWMQTLRIPVAPWNR